MIYETFGLAQNFSDAENTSKEICR